MENNSIRYPEKNILSSFFGKTYNFNDRDTKPISLEFSCFYTKEICYIFVRDTIHGEYHSFGGRLDSSLFTSVKRKTNIKFEIFDPYIRNFVLYIFTIDRLENITNYSDVPMCIAYCHDMSNADKNIYVYEFDGTIQNAKIFTSIPSKYIRYLAVTNKLQMLNFPLIFKIQTKKDSYSHLLMMKLFPNVVYNLTTRSTNSNDIILNYVKEILTFDKNTFIPSFNKKQIVVNKKKRRPLQE